jgi:chemotaxis protein methyltransferase CheR
MALANSETGDARAVRRPGRGAAAAEGLAGAPPALQPSEFAEICRFAHERFGLDLKSGKEELVSARLSKKLRQHGFRSFRQYFDFVRADASGEAMTGFIDALTTNHTSFLREPVHFDFLRQTVLGTFGRARPLRIWSAACSTGEEPYSIVCSVLARSEAGAVSVLATDISARVLEIARRGVYPASSLAAMPRDWLSRFFQRGRGASEGLYRIKAEVAAQVEFRRLNLIESTARAGAFHVIFCRNVMIYFDKPTQQRLVRQLGEQLVPGGYLFVGHSESLAGVDHALTYVRPAIYRRAAGEHGR